jgi:hypothetical protein
MKPWLVRGLSTFITVLVVLSAGCTIPGEEIPPGQGDPAGAGQTAVVTTPPRYVTEVTPYAYSTPVGGESPSKTIPPTTRIPQDLSCRIYTTTNTYAYNKTAVAFNLQNPPMYINYTVKPSNITIHRIYDSKIVGVGEKSIKIDTYSPVSWFEIIVRSRQTGEIYLQDGFGTAKGYTTYLNRTLKVLKRDDMVIEFGGNNITATASVWVKPEGNFMGTPPFNTATDCTYWDFNPRDALAQVTATATPTYYSRG